MFPNPSLHACTQHACKVILPIYKYRCETISYMYKQVIVKFPSKRGIARGLVMLLQSLFGQVWIRISVHPVSPVSPLQTCFSDPQQYCYFLWFLHWALFLGILPYPVPKRSTSCTFAVLLNPTTTHLADIFSNYFPSLSPQKQVNMRIYKITVFWIWRHIRPSTHAPLNSVVNQNGGVLTYFDEP